MSQHDLNVANQSRTNFRQDLNNALEAIASQQSGPGDPAIIYPFQTKINTSATPAVMYIRNAANTAWVRYGYINASTGQLILDNATDADTLDGVHLAALLQKSGGNMTGAINEAADTIAAHATACDIWSKPNNITLTGDVVTFTDLADAPQAGAVRWIKSNAAHVLTNNENLIVQGGANVTLASGDWFRVEAITTTTFNILVFKADGKALVDSNEIEWDYTSAATTIAAGTLYTFAHGLGAKLSDAFVSLICVTTEGGWAVGDEIEFFAYGDSAWTSHQGYGWDATNIYVWVNATALAGFQKGGGGINLTASKWNLIVRGRK